MQSISDYRPFIHGPLTTVHSLSSHMSMEAARAAAAPATRFLAPEMHWNLHVSGVGSTAAPVGSGG